MIALISYSFRKLKKGEMGRGQNAEGVRGNSYSKNVSKFRFNYWVLIAWLRLGVEWQGSWAGKGLH